MKVFRCHSSITLFMAMLVVFVGGLPVQAAVMGTAFTYQGQLTSSGTPVSGTCDFQLILYDALVGGSQIGPIVTRTGVTVTNGLFTTSLDFGSGAFDGNARWLEIATKCGAEPSYTTLSPRQELTPTPYALYAAHGGDGDITAVTAGTGLTGGGTTGDVTLNVNTTTVQSRVSGSCPAGQSIRVVNADGTVSCETDDDTNTTYFAGTGLTLTGTTFAANTTYLQRRVSSSCPAGNSIRVVNADGTVSCEADTGVFENYSGVVRNTGAHATNDFVFGSPQLDSDGDSTHYARMFFDKSKNAFRAGWVSGTQWDDANVGSYSTALGVNTTASGGSSTALGSGSIASGILSMALGDQSVASGNYSTALGFVTTASGGYATTMGYLTTASGSTSTAMGDHTTAIGNYSIAMGISTTAESYVETAIGRYNTDYTPASTSSWNATDRLFVIGNGTGSAARSDALVMLKNGDTTLNGVLTLKLQSAAPFACTSAKYGSIAVNSVGVPCVCALNGAAGWYSLFNGSACSW